MNRDIQKLILEKHQIIRDNQNAKEYVLRRLIYSLDVEIRKLQSDEIRRLKSFLWEKERECEKHTIKINKNQQRLKC